MAKCDCYFQHGTKFLCYGTKEMEECSCGGDESKCNFYPEKRKRKMATEKRLIPFGEKVTLYDLPFGAMFAFGDDCIAVKSEYTCGNGLIESFILGSGEQFWGDAKTAKEQNELMVQPLEIVDVDAVEVVHGRWKKYGNHDWRCSACQVGVPYEYTGFRFCPNCGAKMDGVGNA